LTKINDNPYPQFYFSFFTSSDNHQIRWGKMQAAVASSDVKGVVLLLNGKTEFMEKYREVASKFSHLGYHVMSLDWRGQGLSFRELDNHDKGYVKNFQHYINDLELFYNLFITPLKLPVNILAHSMGGHIALRFLAQCSTINNMHIQQTILLSPMVDILIFPVSKPVSARLADWGARMLADLTVMAGLEAQYVPGQTDYCRETVQFKENVLTHDINNFWLEHREIEKNRELALGGVTWGWLKAAFDSIDILKSEKYLSRIKNQVSIFSAAEDSVVCNRAQQKVCQTLSKGRFISIPGARHEILFETEEIRKVLWSHILSLLNR